MYQQDISGQNAIDYAFEKNAIFCIKDFVETLLLTNEVKFRNCFDKALLLMLARGMDVKELVNSQLFYPLIWTKYTLFSPNQESISIPYNGEIEDIEYEDPNKLFHSFNMTQSFDTSNASFVEISMMKQEKSFYESEQYQLHLHKSKDQEQFEMQYNYILMELI